MKLVLLVGPPGSGKSTLAKKYVDEGYIYINQDEQGKGHLYDFDMAILEKKNVLVDRMNFNKFQRSRYLDIAKQHGYYTSIFVLHESYDTCMERMKKRTGHPTISDETTAEKALRFFFRSYERVEDSEANDVIRTWPGGKKPSAIICDLDGTLCDVEHRIHHVRRSDGQKKDWFNFFREIPNDPLNKWCADILRKFSHDPYESKRIVLCSGRDDNQRKMTQDWLSKHNIFYNDLYMRQRGDSRQDNVVKEIILDFEILTRFTPYFMIDDRKQVVDMWRRRGFTCLQCAEGDF
jgi:predicted kinase